MDLKIEHLVEGAHDLLAVSGELDLATYATLRNQIGRLIDEGRTNVVVDLSGTEFLDSTALGALIGGRRRTYAAGGSFTIVCDRPQLLRLFAVTKLDLVFTIFGSRAAWRESLPA